MSNAMQRELSHLDWAAGFGRKACRQKSLEFLQKLDAAIAATAIAAGDAGGGSGISMASAPAQACGAADFAAGGVASHAGHDARDLEEFEEGLSAASPAPPLRGAVGYVDAMVFDIYDVSVDVAVQTPISVQPDFTVLTCESVRRLCADVDVQASEAHAELLDGGVQCTVSVADTSDAEAEVQADIANPPVAPLVSVGVGVQCSADDVDWTDATTVLDAFDFTSFYIQQFSQALPLLDGVPNFKQKVDVFEKAFSACRGPVAACLTPAATAPVKKKRAKKSK